MVVSDTALMEAGKGLNTPGRATMTSSPIPKMICEVGGSSRVPRRCCSIAAVRLHVAQLEQGRDLLLRIARGPCEVESLPQKRGRLLHLPALIGHHAALVEDLGEALGVAQGAV